MKFWRHRESGFTLPELLVVVAVVGILTVVAVPSFQSLTQSQRVKNASFELFSSLSLARSEAIKRGGNVTLAPLVVGDWGQGWTVTSAGGESIRSQAALTGVSITPGAAGSVIYARTGRAAPAASFEIDASAGATANIRCIQIDLSGMPRVKKAAC